MRMHMPCTCSASSAPQWHGVNCTYIRTYVHTYIHTYIRTYIHTYVHTYVHTYMHTYIRAYMYTYIRAFVQVARGGSIWLYVHEEVPGITIDRTTPLLMHKQLLKQEQPSRIVRYSFPCMLLARWTERALHSLRRSSRHFDETRVSAPFVHSCPTRGTRGPPHGVPLSPADPSPTLKTAAASSSTAAASPSGLASHSVVGLHANGSEAVSWPFAPQLDRSELRARPRHAAPLVTAVSDGAGPGGGRRLAKLATRGHAKSEETTASGKRYGKGSAGRKAGRITGARTTQLKTKNGLNCAWASRGQG